jgi:hypothetical protein
LRKVSLHIRSRIIFDTLPAVTMCDRVRVTPTKSEKSMMKRINDYEKKYIQAKSHMLLRRLRCIIKCAIIAFA